MKTLTFSYNWNNKLNCQAFTTIRLSSKFEVGEKVKIIFKDKSLGYGQIIDIRGFYLKNLNDWLAMIDTGFSADECRQILKDMYKNKNVNWDTQILHSILIKKTTSLIAV